MSVPYRNRTYNRVLGGPRYIHLTKGTNAVFSGFFSSPGYGCHIYESNTKWWISIVTYFDIQVNPYWNRTLTYHFLTSVGVNHGWTLGGPRYIHLTKETNAVFSGFSALLAPAAISMNSITLVMNFHCILFWHSGQSLLESNSDLSLSNFHKSQPWLNLRRRLLYPFN